MHNLITVKNISQEDRSRRNIIINTDVEKYNCL